MSQFMFVAGVSMIGFMLPEMLAAILKRPVPMAMNIWSMAACALIAASFC